MARIRSPNYPAVPLGQAIALTEKIFSSDRTNAIEKADAAKHMGYSGLTGRTLKLLGALSQYGLLEKVGKGQVRVSKTFVSIIHGLDDNEKSEALDKAGHAPALFQRIRAAFDDDPSERSITSYLMQHGFTDSAVAPVLKSYRETNAFLAEAGVSESYGQDTGNTADSFSDEDEDADEMTTITEEKPKTPPAKTPPRSEQEGLDSLFWNKGPLDFNLSSAGLIVVGKTNSAQELNAFIEKLKALTILLPDTPKEEVIDPFA